MAQNQKNLPNRHHQIIGTSGCGKSSWLRQNDDIKKADIVIVWDPDEDHGGVLCKTRSQFDKALMAGLKVKKNVRIRYSVDQPTEEEFQWFCSRIWLVIDGRIKTAAVIEEIADVTRVGAAFESWGQLLRKGRKYNLQLFVVSQRFAECDKTTKSQCLHKWVGVMENWSDRVDASRAIGIDANILEKLSAENPKKIEYYYKKAGGHAADKKVFDATKK